jgi:hypothetical protein
VFWFWIVEAIIQAAGILIVCVFAICSITGDPSEGRMDNMWTNGLLVYALVVIVANVKVIMFSYSHYPFSITIIVLSILSYFIVAIALTELFPINEVLENYDSRGGILAVFVNPNSYFASIVVTFGCFIIAPL